MKIFKRVIAFLLVLCFVGVAFVGCNNKKNNEDETNGGSNGPNGNTAIPTNEYGEVSFDGVVPKDELDFEGEKITIMHRETKISSREWYKQITEDELDEAVAMRNETVKSELNVELAYEPIPYGAGYDDFAARFNNIISSDVMNDFHYYDIAANFAYCGAYPAVRDYAANLRDKDTFPFFEFSLPCWNQAIVNNTTMNGRLHYVSGDLNLSLFDAAMVIWYNKTLYDAKKGDEDPDNMQLYALEGLWTYDELYMWASRLYENTNGADQGKDPQDTYGFCLPRYSHTSDSVPYAWDLEFLINNPDGTHEFNIIGNNKAEDAFIKWNNLIDANGNCRTGATVEYFASGCYVFYPSTIYPDEKANMTIREMEDKYGLLPIPKYDADQENYGTTSADFYTLITVLDHKGSTVPTKGEAISAVLQLMAEESYTSVRGYYFNRIIKPKYFGTDDSEGTVTNSIALFDIIIDNIEFEYWTIYSAQLNNIAWLWRDSFRDNKTSLGAAYSEQTQKYEEAIKATDIWLGLRSAD